MFNSWKKGAIVFGVLALIVAAGLQTGTMHNLHGGAINSAQFNASQLSQIAPAAGYSHSKEVSSIEECLRVKQIVNVSPARVKKACEYSD